MSTKKFRDKTDSEIYGTFVGDGKVPDSAIAIDFCAPTNSSDSGSSDSEDSLLTEPARAGARDDDDGSIGKLPWAVLMVIYAIVASDALAMTIMLPFVPEQTNERFGISEEYVGLAAGVLLGAFSIAEFFTGFLIGHVADIYGRKKLILLGLLSGALCTAVYGLTDNYWIALLSRFIAGLTNANIALTKAICADITTGKARAMAFAYQSASFSLSRAISSAAGGPLTELVIPLPIFAGNKFLLPCLVAAGFNMITMLFAIIMLPETYSPSQTHISLKEGLQMLRQDPLLLKLLAAFSLNSFCNGGLIAAYVLFFALKTAEHGLGFGPIQTGIALFVFSLIGFIFQVTCFKRLVGTHSVVWIYKLGVLVLGFGIIALPFTGYIYQLFDVSPTTMVMLWTALILIMSGTSVGWMIALSVLGSMQSNSVPRDRQGLVQGVNQSLSAGTRGLGPILVGLVFSLSLATVHSPLLEFGMLGLGYFICYYIISNLSIEEEERSEGIVLTPQEEEMLLLKKAEP